MKIFRENGLPMTNKNNQNPNQWLCFCPHDINCACGTEDAMDSGILPTHDIQQPIQTNNKIWHQNIENKRNKDYEQTNINKRELPLKRRVNTDPCSQGISSVLHLSFIRAICEGLDPSHCEAFIRKHILHCEDQ